MFNATEDLRQTIAEGMNVHVWTFLWIPMMIITVVILILVGVLWKVRADNEATLMMFRFVKCDSWKLWKQDDDDEEEDY